MLERFPAEPGIHDIVRLDLAPRRASNLMTEYGFVGLGRMGGAMARRLMSAGHAVAAYDLSRIAIRAELASDGAAVLAQCCRMWPMSRQSCS